MHSLASSSSGSRVLVVEKDPALRRLLVRLLERHECRVVSCESAESARSLLFAGETRRASWPDVMLVDLLLPSRAGFALVQEVRRAHPTVPVVLMTGDETDPPSVRLNAIAHCERLLKPFVWPELRAVLDRVVGVGAPTSVTAAD